MVFFSYTVQHAPLNLSKKYVQEGITLFLMLILMALFQFFRLPCPGEIQGEFKCSYAWPDLLFIFFEVIIVVFKLAH